MPRIIAKYQRGQNELITMSQRVIEKMENNPSFPNPPAALAELKTALPEFETALVNARGRDREMVSAKNDKKAIVLRLLAELANYVMVISLNDRTMMLSSGFDVTSNTRTRLTPSIGNLDVKAGAIGEITVRSKNVTGAKAYVHQYCTEPPGMQTVWVSEGSSLNNHTFTGLQSDKRYWFRIVVVGNGGQRAFSPIVSKMID